uniref:(northern house mosquito) hypothetical protein n=1 Tax=Culex pipiens TaxID=7175 RepID=A0A8D8AWR0_CULPI
MITEATPVAFLLLLEEARNALLRIVKVLARQHLNVAALADLPADLLDLARVASGRRVRLAARDCLTGRTLQRTHAEARAGRDRWRRLLARPGRGEKVKVLILLLLLLGRGFRQLRLAFAAQFDTFRNGRNDWMLELGRFTGRKREGIRRGRQ